MKRKLKDLLWKNYDKCLNEGKNSGFAGFNIKDFTKEELLVCIGFFMLQEKGHIKNLEEKNRLDSFGEGLGK